MIWLRVGVLGVLVGLGLAAPPLGAQMENAIPEELVGVDIIDRSGTFIPGDLRFVDESGADIEFGAFLNQGRPIVVQLVYFSCPMLCTLVLNGYLDAAREVEWTPGKDYTVVTVSFDPRDTPELAAQKKANHVAALGRPEAAAGWHFLTGESTQVAALAESLGFAYRWMEERGDFGHGAAMFVLTPDGRISRTLYGVEFAPQDLRLSLLEASEGLLGSPFEKLLLFCFRYDSETHKYALVARNVMKLGGLVTMLFLGSFLAVMWTRDRRRSRAAAA